MVKKSILFIGFIFVSAHIFAQYNKDIFPLKREFKNGGFYISPHATISFGNKETESYNALDTTYDYEVIGRGKWAYGLEVGWFHSFENPRLLHYIEAGVSYRVFKGAAEHQGTLTTPLRSIMYSSDNDYDAQLAVASIRFVNVKQLKKYSYFSTALGVNYNYKVGDSYKRTSEYPFNNEKFIEESMVQFHIQIGIGFLESEKFLFVPTIETPLLTAYPTEDLNPAFSFFSAKYHPVMIGLKILFLRKDPLNCNSPVYEGPVN